MEIIYEVDGNTIIKKTVKEELFQISELEKQIDKINYLLEEVISEPDEILISNDAKFSQIEVLFNDISRLEGMLDDHII